jgi:L-alanine-DL-glutamate epimerase-like enolase superfamily enzyme
MTEVRITGIDIYKARIPMVEPFRISLGLISDSSNLFVRIRSSAGIDGWGEATPISQITGDTEAINAAAAADLARVVLGKDPLDIDGRVRDMAGFLAFNTAVRAAFDVALHDLAAKVAGLPLYAFLHGGKRELRTDVTIGIDTPDVMAQKATKLKTTGVPAIKVKLGTTADEDVARIQRIRMAIGDELPLRVDANQGWDVPTATNFLRRAASLGIEYCEQPIAHWNSEGFKRLREVSSIPIMADESVFDHHDAFKLTAGGCCDYLNIKLAKSAGIHTALKINAVAEAFGARCMLGCMLETRLSLTAGAHLVSARPNICFVDLDSHYSLKEDPVIGGARWDGSVITLPDTPGHGAELDPGFLEGCERETVD